MTERGKHDDPQKDRDLARSYRHAAAADAYHERKSGGPDPAPYDPTIGVTPERPDVPLSDVARPDKADGEDYSVRPSAKGPEHDRLMRGLEPGETSMDREPASGAHREAPGAPMKDAATSDAAGGEAKGVAREPSRYSDAELSGLEPGETSMD